MQYDCDVTILVISSSNYIYSVAKFNFVLKITFSQYCIVLSRNIMSCVSRNLSFFQTNLHGVYKGWTQAIWIFFICSEIFINVLINKLWLCRKKKELSSYFLVDVILALLISFSEYAKRESVLSKNSRLYVLNSVNLVRTCAKI